MNTNLKLTNFFLFSRLAFAIFAIIVVFLPEIALAVGSNNPFDEIEEEGNSLKDFLTGTFMTIVGVVAIVAMAIATMAGKLDWRFALTVGLAILIGINAENIVDALRN